jgi:hypothetical protein
MLLRNGCWASVAVVSSEKNCYACIIREALVFVCTTLYNPFFCIFSTCVSARLLKLNSQADCIDVLAVSTNVKKKKLVQTYKCLNLC